MSWFQSSSSFASLAKNALKEAQKTIDKALDIKDDSSGGGSGEGKGINATVSSMTDAATEFFSSWGNLSGATNTIESSNTDDEVDQSGQTSPNVITTSPLKTSGPLTVVSSLFENTHSTSVANLEAKTDNVNLPDKSGQSSSLSMKSNTSVTDLNARVESVQSVEKSDDGFQSQPLDAVEDSFESSIETSSTSTTVEAVDESGQSLSNNPSAVAVVDLQSAETDSEVICPLLKEPEFEPLVILSPIPANHEQEAETPIPPPSESVDEPLVQLSSDGIQPEPGGVELEPGAAWESESEPLIVLHESTLAAEEPQPESSVEESQLPGEERLLRAESQPPGEEPLLGGESQPPGEEPLLGGESQPPREEPLLGGEFQLPGEERLLGGESQPPGEEPLLGASNSAVCEIALGCELFQEPLEFPSTETLEFESEAEAEPCSSKLSVSSRATSSISVISEEKDSSSSPQISPASQDNNLASSVDSPSFEIISMHQVHHTPQHNLMGLDFLPSSSVQHQHCPNYPSSLIHSLQSTPDRGSPLTHSRSNSNTSSSFDRVEDCSNIRLPKYTGQNFLSSNSSSDIEVIPLHCVENLYPKRRSIADIETQTTESWPETLPVQVKEKVVEIIPAKTSAMLAEKDFEITQLREEGEKLSKKQFELSTAIKKLRQKEKDTDATVKSLKNDLVTKNIDIERITKMLLSKENQDQVQNETITKLNLENRKLLNTINQLRSDLEDSNQNASSMKASLENASLEILQLQNTVSSVQRDTGELDQLTKLNGDLKNRTESLEKEVGQLRQSINSNQLAATTRESELKTQIHNLTQEVHRLQNQLADNSSEIADATMPLSMEIEKLQQELKTMAQASSRRESSLQNKISEFEYKVTTQLEIEKDLRTKEAVLQNSLASLEIAKKHLEIQNSELSIKITADGNLHSEYQNLLTEFSALQTQFRDLNAEISSLRNENQVLGSECTNTRNSLQAETKRNQHLSEQLLRVNQNQSSAERASFSSAPLERQESRNTSPRSMTSEGLSLEDVIMDPGWQNPCVTPKSYFDSFSSVNYIENLQGHLKQKEIELLQLQHEVSQNEKIRKSLNDEIAHLTVNNEELLQRLEKQEGLEHRLAELDQNYNAILQMYGEKVEETDELRMDLQDVKEMYKVQIEQLLKKCSS